MFGFGLLVDSCAAVEYKIYFYKIRLNAFFREVVLKIESPFGFMSGEDYSFGKNDAK
jgi:hypothetical protein